MKNHVESISLSDLDNVMGGLGRLQLLERAAKGRWGTDGVTTGTQGVVSISKHTFTNEGDGLFGAKGVVSIKPEAGGPTRNKNFIGTVDTVGQHVHGLTAVP